MVYDLTKRWYPYSHYAVTDVDKTKGESGNYRK